MKRAEIYIDCPVCFCLIKSENREVHMIWAHNEEFVELAYERVRESNEYPRD